MAMEYENLKNWRKKKEEFEADTDTVINASQQQTCTDRVDSISSIQSAPYLIFCPDDNVDPCLKRSSLQELNEELPFERIRAASVSTAATYSYPQRSKVVNLRSPNKEEEKENAYATVGVDTKSERSQSASKVPNAPTRPLSLVVEQPPTTSTALMDNGRTVSQESDVGSPSYPASRVSDSTMGIQHTMIGHPVAKNSRSVSSGRDSSSGLQMESTLVIGVKPLIMKMLPLYFCMDDGKVYADQNAASIPTHHLVEVKGLERNITLQKMTQPPPIPPVS